ncbi:histidine kinase dimerization/phosphoacceptor domain -containing protein [Azospirillum sp. sgz301742]
MPPPSASAVSGVPDSEQTALLLTSLERAPVAMAVVEGAEHRYRYANAAFRALATGQTPLPGGRLADSFPGLAESECVPCLGEVYRTGQPARVNELRLTRDGGGAEVWDVDCVPLAGPSGVGSVLITVHDVSAKAAALAEKEGLLREVNHRVKNSLQLVSSLLTLQALSSIDPDMRRQFQEACGRIGTIAQVHQRLYQSETYSVVAFGQYLRDLCRELSGSLSAAEKGRGIMANADEIDLPADTVIPLALVVNELVTNAMKYAYADGQTGDVAVDFRVMPDGRKQLTVADRGRGLPDGFDVERADTLGMKVVRAFAGQLKGRFRAEPNGPGTRFIIDLPA